MKKKSYIKFSIVWILTSTFIIEVHAQSMDETKKMASHFYTLQDFEQTEALCHRILCFGNEVDNFDANYLLGKTYLETYKFKKSIFYFQEAMKTGPFNEDLFFNYLFALINDYQFDVALTELEATKNKDISKNRYLLYKGICYFMKDDLLVSKTTLDSLAILNNKKEVKPRLDSLFSKVKYKNPRTAQIFSAIIPGSGQLYAGDVKNSTKAFGLNISLLTATAYICKKYSVANAGLATFQWFIRYYLSNIKKASNITFQKNDMLKAKSYKDLLFILESCD